MMEVWVLSTSSNRWTEQSILSVYASKEDGIGAIKRK